MAHDHAAFDFDAPAHTICVHAMYGPKKPKYSVYVHRDPEGRPYVGVTVKGISGRWREHVENARAGSRTAFHAAIRALGSDSFTHEVLANCETIAQAREAEREWIGKLNAISEGYNRVAGNYRGEKVSPNGRPTISEIARTTGVSRETVRRIRDESPDLRARVPERVRKAEDFAAFVPRRPPRRSRAEHCWDLEKIVAARNAQMRGDFGPAVRLARAILTDDAAFVARRNRVAPQKAIAATLVPAPGARGEAVAKKAARSIIAPRSVLVGIVGTLADHGIAIGYIERETNDDGTRVNMRLTEWPLEHVKWNESREVLETRVRDEPPVDINHGDGTWIVFRGVGAEPWAQEACILPAALCWPSHAYALRDWNAGAKSHGMAKVLGELQEGVALADENGTLSPQAQAYLDVLADLVSGEAGAGLGPPGSKTQVLFNGSSAWQVFTELVNGREKAFARIYLGTDAVLGSVGGAPGLDIAELFRVSSGIFQGDFEALETGLRTGLYEPWTAINEGDSKLAPSLKYELPDPDEAKRSEGEGEKLERLHAELERRKAGGMIVTQAEVDALAKTFGVRNVPQLAPSNQPTVSIPLAPADMARVVRVDEARGSARLPAIGGEVGALFLTELETKQAADAKAREIAAQAAADAANAPPAAVPA